METRCFLEETMQIRDASVRTQLEEIAQHRLYQKGELVARFGEKQDRIVLLASGIVRRSFLDGANLEVTDSFATKPGALLFPMLSTAPVQIQLEAITTVGTVSFPLKKIKKLVEQNQTFMKIYTEYLKKEVLQNWQIRTSRYTLTTLERYVWFRKCWPEVEAYTASRYVASFLGMTPETLSRVRRIVKDNKMLAELVEDRSVSCDVLSIKELLEQYYRP